MTKVYTTRELTEQAQAQGRRVTQSYVGRLCRQGRIVANKIGRDWVITEPVAEEWLQNWTKAQ